MNLLCGLRIPWLRDTPARDTYPSNDLHPEKAPKKESAFSASDLARLRSCMLEEKLEVYVVPSGDAHSSEYVGERDRRLTFLSGFTGSAGTAVITLDNAHIFIDGRYWSQAEEQVDQNWTVMKLGKAGVPTWSDFLRAEYSNSERIGLDPWLFTQATIEALQATPPLHLVFPCCNLIDLIWDDQPAQKHEPLFIHPLEYAGETASSKITRVREEMQSQEGTSLLLSDLSEIAWLFNLRGSDVTNCPLFYAYALITMQEVKIFIDPRQSAQEIKDYLHLQLKQKVGIHKLGSLGSNLQELQASEVVLISQQIPFALRMSIRQAHTKPVDSIVEEFKSIKNETEIQGMRQAYLQDAIAWVRWIADLEAQIQSGKQVTEYEAAQLLLYYAKQQEHYFSPSYDPSVGSGYNGSKPHYMPTKERSSVIDPCKPVVVDIGQQYHNGTTDTTRTYLFNPSRATAFQKRAYTRVLQGHIAVDSAVFPNGTTTGSKLDVLARSPLWQDRLDYAHGTGHGVGSFLNVHEGPMQISSSQDPLRKGPGSRLIKEGQCLSIEPGYYYSDRKDGFGIRIENVAVVQKLDEEWLHFERLTRVPISTTLVDLTLMSASETLWLKKHNAECRDAVLPHLQDKRAKRWLKRNT